MTKAPLDPAQITALVSMLDESLNDDIEKPDFEFLLLVTTIDDDRTRGSAILSGNIDDDEVLEMLLLHSLHVSRAMARMVEADKLVTVGSA